ncbi:MAG: hypothetical protein Q8P11_03485 [bacterium]|nr:hypothetical protein [bacterium]
MKEFAFTFDVIGHGRAPTLVAAYLIKKGKRAVNAERFIKLKCQSIHLNNAQQKTLEDFSKK